MTRKGQGWQCNFVWSFSYVWVFVHADSWLLKLVVYVCVFEGLVSMQGGVLFSYCYSADDQWGIGNQI